MMQEKINNILEFISQKSNSRMATHIKNKGANEKEVYGTPQKELKKLYKIYKNDHELALELYKLDNLEARSLATMISDLEKMDEELFNNWIDMTDSFWLINYQLAVTLAGHKDAQRIARNWIMSGELKKVDAGFYAYCWMLGNRKDESFSDEEISSLIKYVEESKEVSEGMAYFIEIVGISYLPLSHYAYESAKLMDLKATIKGIDNAREKGRLGFKRNYLRC